MYRAVAYRHSYYLEGRLVAKIVRPFVLVSAIDLLLIEVLQAVHAFADAQCFVVASHRVPFIGFPNFPTHCLVAGFCGNDDERVVSEINRIAEEKPELIVIPCDCAGARLVDRIARRLNAAIIPAPNGAMLDRFNDKWQFHLFCKQHGLSAPDSRLIGSKHELDFHRISQELGCPFVLKPLYELASVGVKLVSSEEQYRRAIRDNDAYQYFPLMAQRYVKGTDVSVNLLSLYGKVTAVSIQQRDHPQLPSAKIRFIENRSLENAAHRIAAYSGYHGVMNVDARIEEGTGKVFLFESNPRFWRSLNASTWCGLNFVAECVTPSRPGRSMPRLTSGTADIFYHPVIRPAFFYHAFFSPDPHRRRLARAMVGNVWTLSLQIKGLVAKIKRSLQGKSWRSVESL